MPSRTSSSINSRKQLDKIHHIPHALGASSIICGSLAGAAVMFLAAFQSSALTAPTLQFVQNAANAGWGSNAPQGPGQIVGNILQVFLGILGIIFMVLLMYGGFLWLTAGGEEGKVEEANKVIMNALIGLLIVVAAYTFTYFVLQKLIQAFQ